MTLTPHDALAKDVYSNPSAMASLLRQTLPPRALSRLDLGTLRLLPGTYISEALRETRSDLLFEAVGVEGVAVRIYTLFEHRSTPSRFTALDLLRYQVDIWQDFLKNNPTATFLPAVVPVVLYHGPQPWEAPQALAALVDLSAEALEDLAFAVPDLRFLLRDLNHYTDEELRAQAATALDRLAQLLLRHGRDPDLIEQLDGWRQELVAVARESGLRAIHIFLSYLGRVQAHRDRTPVRRLLSLALGEAAGQEVFMTWQDQIAAEGEARGVAIGEARGEARGVAIGEARGVAIGEARGVAIGETRGEARGEARGQRSLLLTLLRARFGEPSPAVKAAIEAASVDQLTAWGERFLQADSPEALLRLR